MIIPVIFSLSPVCDNVFYAWVFYKSIDIVKPYGWPVFAQKQYYDIEAERLTQDLFSEAALRFYDYGGYQPEDINHIIPEVFPPEKIEAFTARFPSQTDAYLASLSSPWPEMTDFLVERVREAEASLGEKAEAFLCLHDAPFIREAAKQLGIDVIHFEWGPFRMDTYRSTAYLDFTGSVCDGEMSERYRAFQTVASQVPVFTRREIQAIFLTDKNLHYAIDEDPEPEFAGGLALGYNIPHIFSAENQVSALEMQTRVREVLGDGRLQVRYHPGDPVHARLDGVQEDTGNLIDFIRSSRRLFTINSNVDYEAMLYNRPVYDLGDSQYGLFANHDLAGLPDRMADETFLSFIAFGYLVPFELIKSVEYLRWRLSRPGEDEIYRYHLNYYLNCLQIPEEVLDMPPQERFRAILERRGVAAQDDISLQDAPIWMKTDEVSRLSIRLHRLEDRYERARRRLTEVEEERQSQDERIHALESLVEWERSQQQAKEAEKQEVLKERGALDERIHALESLVEWERSQQRAREDEQQKLIGALGAQEQRIRDLEGLVDWERDRSGALQEEKGRLTGEIERLDAQLAEERTRYQALLTSRWYRYTRPLDRAMKAVKRLIPHRSKESGEKA